MKHIAVIGAGITGITTAYQLLDQGFEVTVFDRNRYAAMDTSFANGGQLSASNAEVWTTWATIFKGLKWMMQADAPLLVNPKPSLHKYGWMAEFLSNIPNYRRNTVDTVKLALQARNVLFDMADREGVDFNHETRGIVHFYKSEKDMAHARKVSGMLAEGGLSRRELSRDEVSELEPALQNGDYVGGFHTESDSTGDIHRYTMGLANGCERRGAHLRFGVEIADISGTKDSVNITPTGGAVEQFDGVVVCAGIGSRAIAAKLGDRVNIYPVKGYSITVDLNDAQSQAAAPWMSLLDDDTKIVTSRLGVDRFRVAGTAEFNGYNRDIRADRINPLVSWVEKYFPGVCTENVVPWAGLRPMMPNMMPKVGRGSNARVFYNTGHGHLGWTLSAATAQIVAGAVANGAREWGADVSPRPVLGLQTA